METAARGAGTEVPYRLALPFVTSLFFLWGLAYGLLDVLNKHFQESLQVGKAQSGWLQAAYFGGYFVASFPAGAFMQRYGYRAGIIGGLLLYAAGAFLFIPAAVSASFMAFLAALFILACGLSCLETAANPYVTILGPSESAERRLNLSQSFNGLGSFLGPLIGGALLFAAAGAKGSQASLGPVAGIYAVIGSVVLAMAWAFGRIDLPPLREPTLTDSALRLPLHRRRHLVLGVVTQFFYVAAQVGVGAFFINFVTEHWQGLDSRSGAFLLSIGMLCFLSGRFFTTWLMTRIRPQVILCVYALCCTVLTLIVAGGLEKISVIALIAVFFFMSIMFPTIFSLGVKDLGENTKRGSSWMIAAIIGGAVLPYVMGMVAERTSTATAYLLPAGCFGIVVLYAWRGYRVQ